MNANRSVTRGKVSRSLVAVALAIATLASAQQAEADAKSEARRIHDRLVGTPPSAATLSTMEGMVASNNAIGAAEYAINPTSPDSAPFYSVTLKNFATPWTNRDGDVFAELNDYTATVIGMVRDDVPFNQVLSEDIIYVGSGTYSMTDNEMYRTLESNNADLRNTSVLRQTNQSVVMTGIPADATAGIITTRGAASAFFIDGTNRAMFRFTLMNHLCRDLEQVHDTALASDRIRQDVTRSPGGDSRVFLNNCIGCHTGMDPMAQAFAYYDFDENGGGTGRLVYTPGQVQPKYLINSDNFKPGFVTPDDHWTNYWRRGQNRSLGWSPNLTGDGNGAKSLGQELAGSDAFAQCQVEKVFRTVCYRAPSNAGDRQEVGRITASFKGNYNLKNVFAQTAVYCSK